MVGKRNLLLIAAAGAGKTTHIVCEALNCQKNVLITTFTTENEGEIRRKIIQRNGFVPENITIQTWFSFLLEHGIRPYQGCVDERMFDYEVKGLHLSNQKSGVKYKYRGKTIVYDEKKEFFKHFFDRNQKIYSDKIAKFVYRACKASGGAVIRRIEKIFPTIYIDEVQDLAGYDLELVKELMSSASNVVLVGDPRQVTYYTHWETKNSGYRNGNIENYLKKCPKKLHIEINKEILNKSHRNNLQICDFSSLVYQGVFPKTEPCSCPECHSKGIAHQGIFLVKQSDIKSYLQKNMAIQLIWSKTNSSYIKEFPFSNIGMSKGKSFDHVAIYPTEDMSKWLESHSSKMSDEARAKLYVAITRARYSVAFVLNDDKISKVQGIPIWSP